MIRRTALTILLACIRLHKADLRAMLHDNPQGPPNPRRATKLRYNLAAAEEAEQWVIEALRGKAPGKVDDKVVALLAALIVDDQDAGRGLLEWCDIFEPARAAALREIDPQRGALQRGPLVPWLRALLD